MLPMKLDVLFFLLIFRVSHCQRRIEGGLGVSANKPYVVYFVKASISDKIYDSWLCGGALVTQDFIITSAACVEDVHYLYAIAGYNKYVTHEDLENNKCTKKMKKKVTFTCVPVSYEFDFDKVEKWAQIDIALARVESPYSFTDTAYLELCSYIPTKIAINYDPKYQAPDTDCMVMGWGHDKKYRKEKDKINYNSPILKYTSTLVTDKQSCIKAYEYYPQLAPVIQQYMICTMGESTIDDAGQPKDEVLDPKKYKLLDGCQPGRRMGQENLSCIEQNDDDKNTDYMNARRQLPKANGTFYNYTTRDYIKTFARQRSLNATRRNGICQNDHGGPLVTWVGTTEVLIGVASVFQIDEDYNCIGPFLHTSTQSNAAFIDCILKDWNKKKGRRNALCDSPPSVRGFDTVENHISWKDHPAGPAENELLQENFGPPYKQAPRG